MQTVGTDTPRIPLGANDSVRGLCDRSSSMWPVPMIKGQFMALTHRSSATRLGEDTSCARLRTMTTVGVHALLCPRFSALRSSVSPWGARPAVAAALSDVLSDRQPPLAQLGGG